MVEGVKAGPSSIQPRSPASATESTRPDAEGQILEQDSVDTWQRSGPGEGSDIEADLVRLHQLEEEALLHLHRRHSAHQSMRQRLQDPHSWPDPPVARQQSTEAMSSGRSQTPEPSQPADREAAVITHILSKPEKPPQRRNLVAERLQTAHLARSYEATRSLASERSPFRSGSPLAPMQYRQTHSHSPSGLRWGATTTVSPKDALLDYEEPDQGPLF